MSKAESKITEGIIRQTLENPIPKCLNCGIELEDKKTVCGIKNPCGNCGYSYPMGDCSD